jgi:hypothetical protein
MYIYQISKNVSLQNVPVKKEFFGDIRYSVMQFLYDLDPYRKGIRTTCA